MQKGLAITNRIFIYGGLLLGVLLAFYLIKAVPADASAGINQTISFQGRLLNGQGATVPDGFYNIEFKIYQDGDGQSVGNTTGSPSGSLKWTEDYLNNNSQGVRVVNGYLSVQLGSVTAFGSNIDWNQGILWLSMNIAGTGGACATFAACSPDGEMVPMQPLTSAPYAFNSSQLGGLTASNFVQLAQGVQTDSSTTNPSIFINKTGATAAILELQKSSSDVLLVANDGSFTVTPATSGTITLGSTSETGTISLGRSTDTNTISIGSSNSLASGKTQTINIGTSTGSGSTTNVNIGSSIAGTVTVNSGLTLASGKTLTLNGEGFTDLTGTGLVDSSNTLSIDQSSSLTWTGTEAFNGATTFTPSGSNNVTLTGDNDSNVQVSNTLTSDVTQTGLTVSLTDNASASTGTVYGLSVTNADNTTNTGVPDAVAYLNNANAADTVPSGLLVEQTGAGTLSNGIEIKRTAGTVNNGLTFTGTFATNYINSPNFFVTGAGAIGSVGLDAHAGLIQGTGGLSVSGTITLGSTSQTNAITLGQSTDTNTISIGSNNSLASGKTQTINIGTSTGSGSTTNVNIGSSVAGTTTVNGALTLNTGKTLTVNGDAFTDLTGTGLTNSSNALSIDQAANLTWTGTHNFNGATAFTPSSANNVTVNGDNDSKFQVLTTLSSDVSQNGVAFTLTDNASASTGTVYGLAITNADNGANIGVPDALAYLKNDNGAETVPDGLLIEQTGAGTLTNGLEIKRTTGTITNGLVFTGTGYTNYIDTPSSTFKVDGSGNVTTPDITCASTTCITLGTETGGNYVQSVTNGTGIAGGNGGSEGSALTLSIDQTASLTWTGTETFTPSGSNNVVVNGDDNSNLQVASTVTGNTSSDGLAITWTDNGSGTNTAAALKITNAANGTNAGVPAALAYLLNSNNTADTIPDGLLVEQNGSGSTLTNGIEVKQTAGTLSTGLQFTGTFGNLIKVGSTVVVDGSGNISTARLSGNYVATISNGTGISGSCSSNACAASISIDQTASLTWTGTENFNGATAFTPSGGNNVSVNGDDDSNFRVSSIIGSDSTQNGLDVTITDNASASTGSLYGLSITNADNSSNTGVPDAIAYLKNANAAETVPDGLLIEQTGAGTLTNGLEIKRTAGTITNGLVFSGTGYTNYIDTPSSTFKVDGSGNVTAADITCASTNCIALSTETSGNYVASITNGTGIAGGNGGSEGSALTISIDQSSSLTWTGTEAFNGATTFTPSSSNNVSLTGDNDSNVQVSNTITSDVTQTGLVISLTDNASASTGSVYGLSVTNNDNSTNTGVPDAIAYFKNANSAETVPSGLLVEQTGSGTLTNGLEIKRTAGTISSGLTFTGSFTNLISTSTNNFTVTNGGAVSASGNLTIGASAGSGTVITNNGATINATLALTDFAAGGSIGSAATTVDIYTSISVAQTTAGQTLTIPSPTASTSYGRVIYISNIGTNSFTIGTTPVNVGGTATLVWSNTNGGASWQFAGVDNNSILNQSSSDQTANFRISGTGRANTSFTTPLVDSITGALSLGTSTATGVTIGGTTNTTAITLQGAASAAYTIGTANNTGGITVGNSTDTNTIAIGNANTATGKTQTINIGAGTPAGTGLTNVTIGNSVNSSSVTLVAGTGNINLNSGTIATNASTLNLFNTNATTVNQLQAATTISMGATSGTLTVRNANQTFGNAAGSGVFTNNGATLNTTLALTNFVSGGAIGTAAATVDIYTSISVNQTTSGQTLTIPTPTASTSYGRTIYLANIGTASFIVSGIRIPPGATATLIWSNTNGGASWHFAGAGGTSIENQNTSDQSADFRINGTGRANTSFTSPLFDSITGALGIGTSVATAVNVGGTANTTSILLQGAAAATYTIGTSGNTGGITLGNSTATNTIAIGNVAGNGATQTINIGTSATSGSTTRVNIGSSAGGYTQVNGSLGVGTSTTPAEKLDVNGAIRIGTTTNTNAGTIRYNSTTNDFEGYNGTQWKSMTTQYLSVNPVVNQVKSSDTIFNNNNTPANDPVLKFTIGANETWNFRFVMSLEAASRNAGWKILFDVPQSTSSCVYGYGDFENAISTSNTACTSITTIASQAANNAPDEYEFMGIVVNGSTAQTITIKTSQNTATAANSIVRAGSFLQANRVLSAGDATLSAFVNNGNTFGVAGYLGTNDAYDLFLQTNGQTLADFSSSNGSALFKNYTNSTAGFDVQTSSGTSIFRVDTTNSQVLLGKASSTNGQLVFKTSSGASNITLNSGATSSDYTITLPTSGGSANQCLQLGGAGGAQLQWGACGTNSTGLAKNAADSSSASVSASSQLYSFTNAASATASGVLKLDNGTNTNSALVVTGSGNPASGQAIIFASNTNASPSGNLMDLQAGSSPTSKFSVSSSGAITLAGSSITGGTTLSISSGGANAVNLDTGGGAAINIGSTNATSLVLGGNTSATITEKVANSSTTAFQLQTAGATNILVADSTNSRLIVGSGSNGSSTPFILVLDNKASGAGTSDPTGVNGALYYNTDAGKFRCYENGAWTNCIGASSWPSSTLASDASSSSAASYTTAFTYTPPASSTVHLDFFLTSKTDVSGTAVQYRVRSADSTNVGDCVFRTPTAATTTNEDLIALGTAPADTGETAVLDTNAFPVLINCSFTSGATPANVILEFQCETGTGPVYTLKGSYYQVATHN